MQDGFFLHLLLLPIKIILIKEVHIFEINLSNKQRWQQDQPEFDSVESAGNIDTVELKIMNE